MAGGCGNMSLWMPFGDCQGGEHACILQSLEFILPIILSLGILCRCFYKFRGQASGGEKTH